MHGPALPRALEQSASVWSWRPARGSKPAGGRRAPPVGARRRARDRARRSRRHAPNRRASCSRTMPLIGDDRPGRLEAPGDPVEPASGDDRAPSRCRGDAPPNARWNRPRSHRHPGCGADRGGRASLRARTVTVHSCPRCVLTRGARLLMLRRCSPNHGSRPGSTDHSTRGTREDDETDTRPPSWAGPSGAGWSASTRSAFWRPRSPR